MTTNIAVYDFNSVKQALEIINNNSKGAVVVVDSNNVLIRLLTDGDIRRALLKGNGLETQISEAFKNNTPIFIREGFSYSKALKLMDSKEIDHLAVINEEQKVIDLCHRKDLSPILLSVPHIGAEEIKYVDEAFTTNWVAPLGPNVNGFEAEISEYTGAKHAAALTSGTAALHLSLILLDVKPSDIVLCSSLTFVASANPIMYQHATPVFIDSEPDSWNMSPVALEKAIKYYLAKGNPPKAMIVVNLYGQSADMDAIVNLSEKYNVPIVEDAAESLGSKYKSKHSGTFGLLGVYSFNGNKIITTSGGGMLVSDDKELIDRARFLATQARDTAPYYQHSVVGYNYRMSNVLAGIGRGQLEVIDDRVKARRNVFQRYVSELSEISCIEWMPEIEGYYSNRWLSTFIIDPQKSDISAASFIDKMNQMNIEARHVWKPMHLQPVFKSYKYFKHSDHSVSDHLFEQGVCLPSASSMTENDQNRVINAIKIVLMG
jgi:dTDP-4-amino-4,6-dideoxygalactose transaminase